MDDVRALIYRVLALFVLTLVTFITFIYLNACGFTFTCHSGDLPVERTPIPTLIPATLPVHDVSKVEVFNKCQVAAVDLIGAWVTSGYHEKDAFQFTDAKGQTCEATFAKDVQPLFLESNLWYPGSLACASCHQPDLTKAIKNMDLSSYAGILAGSGRANGEAKGNDILGGGDWNKALLHQMLYAPNGQTLIGRPAMPFGRPANVPENGPLVFAGQPSNSAPSGTSLPAATATPTALVPQQDVARPSNPGGPGPAVDLVGNVDAGQKVFEANCVICHNEQGTGGKPNPGSTDGTVPPLNPIDPTLKSTDNKTYSTNIDLFIEHGSTPDGTNPILNMPSWGDSKHLTPQQIADVIAYIISLNK